MDFTPSLLKNGWQNAVLRSVLLWCMLQAGPPSLHYYCTIVLHSYIVLSPVGHSSNHEYHCFQLTKQSSCVSNFYRTFNVFVWLALVLFLTWLVIFRVSCILLVSGFWWVKCQSSQSWFYVAVSIYFLDILCRGTRLCSVLPAVRCVAYCPELGGTSKVQFVQILRF